MKPIIRINAIAGLCLAFSLAGMWAADPPSTSSTKKKTTKSAAKKPGSKSAAKKGKKGAKTPTQTWRNRQMQPDASRYKDIQSALVEKGYLKSEANGVWGADSQDALKNFQRDQNLEPSGKIDSVSLIALGLGPKRDTIAPPAQSTPPRPPAAPTSPPY